MCIMIYWTHINIYSYGCYTMCNVERTTFFHPMLKMIMYLYSRQQHSMFSPINSCFGMIRMLSTERETILSSFYHLQCVVLYLFVFISFWHSHHQLVFFFFLLKFAWKICIFVSELRLRSSALHVMRFSFPYCFKLCVYTYIDVHIAFSHRKFSK